MFEGAPRELQRLSDSRWACRYITCRNLTVRLSAVKRVLEDISEESHPDRAVEARGLLGQIDLNFTGLLSAFKKVLGSTTFLSDMLQSPKLDLSKAVDLIGALKQTFEEYRSETYLNSLWDEIMQTCDNCGISSDMSLHKRKKQLSRTLQGCVVTSTVGQDVKMESKETFKLHLYYPIIDCMIGEIERRFTKLNCGIMKGIQALNPSSSNFLDEESIALLAKAYDADMQDLQHELHQTR